MTTPTPSAAEIERLVAVLTYHTLPDQHGRQLPIAKLLEDAASALRTIPDLIADADNDRSRYKAQIEGLREALRDVNGALQQSRAGRLMTGDEVAAHDAIHAQIARVLSQPPADLLAQREAERKVIEAARKASAARKWMEEHPERHWFGVNASVEADEQLDRALAALAEQEAGA